MQKWFVKLNPSDPKDFMYVAGRPYGVYFEGFRDSSHEHKSLAEQRRDYLNNQDEQANEFLETENYPYLIASPWEFDLPKFEEMLVSEGLWFSTLYPEDIEDNMKYTFLSQEDLSVAKELLDDC